MIPWSLVCYNWIGVKPLGGTKRKRVRYWGENEVSPLGNPSQLAMTSAKGVARVAVGAGTILELQGANATKYWNFAGSTGRCTLNFEKGRKLGKEASAVSGSFRGNTRNLQK